MVAILAAILDFAFLSILIMELGQDMNVLVWDVIFSIENCKVVVETVFTCGPKFVFYMHLDMIFPPFLVRHFVFRKRQILKLINFPSSPLYA